MTRDPGESCRRAATWQSPGRTIPQGHLDRDGTRPRRAVQRAPSLPDHRRQRQTQHHRFASAAAGRRADASAATTVARTATSKSSSTQRQPISSRKEILSPADEDQDLLGGDNRPRERGGRAGPALGALGAAASRRLQGAARQVELRRRHRVAGVGPSVQRVPARRAASVPGADRGHALGGVNSRRAAVPRPGRAGRPVLCARLRDHGPSARRRHDPRRGLWIQVFRHA